MVEPSGAKIDDGLSRLMVPNPAGRLLSSSVGPDSDNGDSQLDQASSVLLLSEDSG
jgi:hypothetical protein